MDALKGFALCLMAGWGGFGGRPRPHANSAASLEASSAVGADCSRRDADILPGRASLARLGASRAIRRRYAQSITPLRSIGYGLEQWSANVIIPFDELPYFAGLGQAPGNVTYWGLRDKQAVDQFVDRLKKAHFAAVNGDVEGLIAKGEANKPDTTKANGRDPWRGSVGSASFVLPLDAALVQASAASGMKTLRQTKPSVVDSGIVAASIAGLKAAVPAADGRIVQATVVSPVLGLQAVNPSQVISSASGEDMETAKQRLTALAESSGGSLPPYFAGVIADVQLKNVPAVVISLSYADRHTAKQAVEGVDAAWKQSMASAVPARISGRTVQADELCAAVVSVTALKAESAGNPILTQVMNRYMQRDFMVLQIGALR